MAKKKQQKDDPGEQELLDLDLPESDEDEEDPEADQFVSTVMQAVEDAGWDVERTIGVLESLLDELTLVQTAVDSGLVTPGSTDPEDDSPLWGGYDIDDSDDDDELILEFRKVVDTATVPTYAHGSFEDAGMDLFAAESAEIAPQRWETVRTGICIEMPPGVEGQVRPRSGLARKHGLTLLNGPGTIDPGYRGEIMVTLINFGQDPYKIKAGDRIAQLIVGRYVHVDWLESDSLTESARDVSGHGSTGR